jgi:broad specificity phosphatase PhoE
VIGCSGWIEMQLVKASLTISTARPANLPGTNSSSFELCLISTRKASGTPLTFTSVFAHPMHLFLIRHGETEHNVAGLLAGVSDSRLTNHGVLQTQRLGRHLTVHRNLKFTRIYASDLQRAFMTAGELRSNQMLFHPPEQVPTVVKLQLLREQDFGSLELVPWASRRVPNATDPSFRPQETQEAMALRAETFLTDFILPLFAASDSAPDAAQECVAVVSHGLFLSVLWQTLLRKFGAGSVALGPDVEVLSSNRPLEYLPAWTNTGFLEATISKSKNPIAALSSQPAIQSPFLTPLNGYSMTVRGINSKDHLLDLKRARGGLGSVAYDAKQQSLDGFFKRPN